MEIRNPQPILRAYHELHGEPPSNGIPSPHKIPEHPGDRLLEYTVAGAAAARQGLAKSVARQLIDLSAQGSPDIISSLEVMLCAKELKRIVQELGKMGSDFVQLHEVIGFMRQMDAENLWLAIDGMLIYEVEQADTKPQNEKDLIKDYIGLTQLMAMAGRIGFSKILERNQNLRKYFP